LVLGCRGLGMSNPLGHQVHTSDNEGYIHYREHSVGPRQGSGADEGAVVLHPPMALPILYKSAIDLFRSALALPTRYLRPAQTSLIESA
jgi:hypothetical protein